MAFEEIITEFVAVLSATDKRGTVHVDFKFPIARLTGT